MGTQFTDSLVIQASEYGIREGSDCTQPMRELLHAAWEAEQGGREVLIRIKPGIYPFYPDFAEQRTLYTSNTDSEEFPEKRSAILIEGHEGLTIDGNGALFVLHGELIAVTISHSKRITLRNFSWDFAVPTVSEMTVTGMGTIGERAYTDFSVPHSCPFTLAGADLLWNSGKSPYHGEYYWVRRNDHDGCTLNVYDEETDCLRRRPTTQNPFQGRSELELLPPEREGQRLRIYYGKDRPVLQKPGRTFEMLATPKRPYVGALLQESTDVCCLGVNVHFMHGFGWLVQMCRNVTFQSCRFEPRTETGRHCTSFADSLHVSGCAGTVTVENCRFTHALDDPVNIHGTYMQLTSLEGAWAAVRYMHPQQAGFGQYHVGDEVVLCRRSTLLPLMENGQESVYRVQKVWNPLEDGNDIRTARILLDRPPVLEGEPEEYAVENITYAPEVLIRGCAFRVIPTRGLLCTTRKRAVIEDNLFENLTMSGISISDDANAWYESGPVHDMVIRRNRFRLSPSWMPPEDKETPKPQEGCAAILICPEIIETASAPVHRNILIAENEFQLDDIPVVIARGVDGLRIERNHISSPKADAGSLAESVTPADPSKQSQPAFQFVNCINVLTDAEES